MNDRVCRLCRHLVKRSAITPRMDVAKLPTFVRLAMNNISNDV